MTSPAEITSSTEDSNVQSQIPLSEATKQYEVKFDGINDNVVGHEVVPTHCSTKQDQRDMNRMGKSQELIRNFPPLSTFSFGTVLSATWEFLLIANTQGLVDGGLAGLFWSYVWTFIGCGFVTMSLAEMASMAPISGGQYHWVSEFAPPDYQKPLSYITGWMSVLSWQAGNASGSFLTGTIIEALLTINYPNYTASNWQGTLFVFAMALLLCIANIWGAKLMPRIQTLFLALHIAGFLVVVIVLWAKAPHQPPSAVFTKFTNNGGWSSMGLSLMVGQITAIYSSLGADACAHMSEEVRDAGRYVPIAMFWSYFFNGLVALVLLVTYLFSIDSIDNALADPSGYPFIYVFSAALPMSGVNALTIIIVILVYVGNIDYNASTSRQTFAFARDNGLPFPRWIGAVHKEIPRNAILLTCLITALLSVINIGSTSAFNAIISVQIGALTFSYSVSISCIIYRRVLHPELMLLARWSLGIWGLPINLVGLAYVLFAFSWSFWPNATPANLANFNWSVIIFIGIFLSAVIMYTIKGRKVYRGPLAQVVRQTDNRFVGI